MKHLIKVLATALVFCMELYAQNEWFWQYPLPQGNNLYSVQFLDENFGWAVGGF